MVQQFQSNSYIMAQISLNHIQGNSYFSNGFLSIGLYIDRQKAILIDSGNDESCARDLHNALQTAGYHVEAIINTHCHPDHCGGNYFFQKKYPHLKTYTTHDEKSLIEDPNLAPRCFCQGAAAFAGLKNKYLAPQRASIITHPITSYSDQTIIIDDISLQLLTLAGHTPGSIGIITADNIFYAGDALFGKETFRKHPILFYTDIGNTLKSLEKISRLNIDATILYHGGIIYDLPSIVKEHQERIFETKNFIMSLIKQQPFSIDLLTQRIMQEYKIPYNIIAFTLTQTTIRAYLTYLESEKCIELQVSNGLLEAVANKA